MIKLYEKALLPAGFSANGLACGLKKSGKPDLALIYSKLPAFASACFTANKIKAAPILLTQEHLKKTKTHRAIIVNSGNANCFTGAKGRAVSEETAQIFADELGIRKESVLVNSTGIIGKQLPVNKIKKAAGSLVRGLSEKGINKASRAIMTTDTFLKEVTADIKIGNTTVRVCGIAKGAGMIAPDLATMLAFITTDASITRRALDKALKEAVARSFNCITVDGCMSTNDTVIVLANAASQNALIDMKPIGRAGKESRDFILFCECLQLVCLELAKMIIRDAEGATKFIRIHVKNARNYSDARKAALAIANSNLFKTAMYGCNPNFGRVAASVGASGVAVTERGLKIKLGPLHKKNIDLEVNLSTGSAEATIYTSDLSPEYVKINAAYS
ncbi:MAG: bifunctional glutamate N-acetyltransferase/amino-acid acetyltransferase ArgJ [Candidatus Omnitrophota bacterium]|jgi:glutamate N-acetyltransferase/amino-acid N-acetyltransferase